MYARTSAFVSLVIVTLGVALTWAAASPFAPLAAGDEPEIFPRRIERTIGGSKVKLVRTGKAVRKQLGFKVYDVASYLAEDAKAKSAEELAAATQPKLLHLIFTMKVSGDDMANAFESILRQNYPQPAFTKETQLLLQHLRKSTVRKGDHILMTHIPDKGLEYRLQNNEDTDELLIASPAFSRAVWDNYLGENNCGENVKLGLIAELNRAPKE